MAYKNQNKLLSILFTAIFLLFPFFASAKSYNYEKIKVDIQVNKDGLFDVAEERGEINYNQRQIIK